MDTERRDRVMKIPKLSCGLQYGYDVNNRRICVGSQMGRRNHVPADTQSNQKLHLIKLRLNGDYDSGGAYFGYVRGTYIYRAINEETEIFVRATDREDAKNKVREYLKNARFYR